MSYTTGTAFLEALLETGVEYVFCNLGSDHTSIVEAYAAGRRAGKKMPQLITAPHEFVAMTAAHGYAMVTGRAQAVVVHVECGTQSLAGAVHNAAKGRVPLFVFAGASPATQDGEARGSRNEFIQWLQDVFDQRGLVRGYMRYDNEIRVGANVKQLIARAMQFAHSEPKGPVYMVGPREIMEQEIAPVTLDRAKWPAIAPAALPPGAPENIATLLANAKRPLIVTSYAGRNLAAVEQLVRLAQRLGIGVHESVPNHLSFPHDHPLYQGSQWNEKRQSPQLAEADVILVVDSDVPWIPQINRPSRDARIIHIDTDPLKQQMPLWYIGAEQVYRADVVVALGQINSYLDTVKVNESLVNERRGHYERLHAEREEMLRKAEQPTGDAITPEYLSACVGRAIGPDAIVLSEAVTNFHNVANHVRRTKPGTLMASGGGSLGWNGGAAVGVKLAKPDTFVTTMTGDGTYMFSIPGTVHWMSKRYRAPFLQVIFNNRGWRAPRYSAMGVHPEGLASQGDDIAVSFEPPPDYAGIAAAAGGAHAERITRVDEVEAAIARAVRVVREEGRSAVIDASV
ncbi:MAG TPA: thiamine pyrophosphate-requiring protein [Steroidobacteraceae bacterium]|nr:thiamine pyrophosphate-requiring protein [Steroidobacteraceae bacterium]